MPRDGGFLNALKLMRCLAIRSLVCCPAGDLMVSDKSCGYSSSMISIRAFADRIGRLGFNRAPNSLPSLVLDFPTLPPPSPVVSAPSAPLPPRFVLGFLTIFSFGETLQQGFWRLLKFNWLRFLCITFRWFRFICYWFYLRRFTFRRLCLWWCNALSVRGFF